MLPHFIELIDFESKLRMFLHDHAHQLKKARALLTYETPRHWR
jgi:hypothetical protein